MTDSRGQSGTVGGFISRLLAWRPLESWQTVLAAGLAVFLAAALSLVFTGHDPASADTIVSVATHADIELANGKTTPATAGATVPRGASLRTGAGGSARLTTQGRDVYLGSLSTVRVLDGVHQMLTRGLVMIDAQSGPGLGLDTEAGAVTAPAGTLSRVEQNVGTLRLAVYKGNAAITAAGRRATSTVPALHQVRVPYDDVPESATALALTITDGAYDQWEQRLASELVQSDVDLNSFAVGLNGTDGLAVLNAAPAALRSTAVEGRTQGEQALAVAVAQKGRLHNDLAANLAEVERDRGEGGSWGVVAAIVRAPVTDVTSVLGNSLDIPGGGPNGTLAGGIATAPGGQTGTSSPSTGGGGGGGSRSPQPTPTTTNTKSPTPTADPVSDAVKQIQQSLPPTPAPSTTPAPTPAPTATPATGTLAKIISGLLNPH